MVTTGGEASSCGPADATRDPRRPSLTITTSRQRRLGPLLIDPRRSSMLEVTGDLPHRFVTTDPQRYRPLVAAGITTLSAPTLRPPRVSVIIPARNPPETFTSLVDELIRSSWICEIIVVDDGSALPITLKGATIARNEIPIGPGGARNLGARLSTGEVLLFIDADIIGLDDGLGEALKLLHHHQIGALAPRIIEQWHRSPLDLGLDPTLVDQQHLNHLPAAVLAVARETFFAAGGFSEDLHLGEDVELTMRITALGQWALYHPSCTATHASQVWTRRLGKAARYGYSVGALRRRTNLALMPTFRTVPWLCGVALAPITYSLAATLKDLSRLHTHLAFDQRVRVALIVIDRHLTDHAALIVRQLGAPMLLGALLHRKARSALLFAIGIELMHQGIFQTLSDLAYSAGLWLSVVLETC
ncbi:MAG: glycosyltransferase [Ferrimicrobium sp.]